MVLLFAQGNMKTEKMHQAITVTTYKMGRITANGERYDPSKITVAVPRIPHTRFPRHPYGSYVTISRGGNYVRARVTDLCGMNRYDLSTAAMTKLLGRYKETKVKALLIKVETPIKTHVHHHLRKTKRRHRH